MCMFHSQSTLLIVVSASKDHLSMLIFHLPQPTDTRSTVNKSTLRATHHIQVKVNKYEEANQIFDRITLSSTMERHENVIAIYLQVQLEAI